MKAEEIEIGRTLTITLKGYTDEKVEIHSDCAYGGHDSRIEGISEEKAKEIIEYLKKAFNL